MTLRQILLRIIVLAFVASVGGVSSAVAARGAKGKRGAVATRTTAAGKKKSKGKRRGRRRRRPVGPRLYSGVPLAVLAKHSRVVGPGTVYTEKVVSKKNKWRVGVLACNLDEAGASLTLKKAKERAVGFERVEEFARRIDSTAGAPLVLGAVNANYWRAGVGTVLGAAVCGGEVVGFDNIKQWSRFVVRGDGSFDIRPDSISVTLEGHGERVDVAAVNGRFADSTVVLYNHFYGPTVPKVDTASTDTSAEARARRETAIHYMRDTTELFYETDEDIGTLPDSLVPVPRSEERTLKIMATLVDTPRVNAPWRCRITATTSKLAPVLRRGVVLTFPRADSIRYRRFRTGDTITVSVRTAAADDDVRDMCMAGPRLVRHGKVSVETDAEQFHRRSFIAGSHARTAIGYSKDMRTVYFVVVDRPMGTRRKGRPGIGLTDLARIVAAEGAYEAMNFDGGSSTTLVVNDATLFPDTGVDFSRHVASAFCLIRRAAGDGAVGSR